MALEQRHIGLWMLMSINYCIFLGAALSCIGGHLVFRTVHLSLQSPEQLLQPHLKILFCTKTMKNLTLKRKIFAFGIFNTFKALGAKFEDCQRNDYLTKKHFPSES